MRIKTSSPVSSEKIEDAMATIVYQKVFGFRASNAIAAASDEIKRLENLLSCFLPCSDISVINLKAGLERVKIAPETYYILKKSIEISKESQGIFDITSGSLYLLWRKAFSENTLPETKVIGKKRSLVNSSNLELTEETAFLKVKGQMIDLGALGKGFIADKTMESYRRCRVKSAYISIGGNVSLLGKKPCGSLWKVGIRDPDYIDCCVGFINIEDSSVATSGDYEKFMVIDGKRYHHIIDVRNGYPADSGLRSVTVVCQSSLLADALATAAFILGLEEGLNLVRHYEAEAIFIDKKRKIILTSKLKDLFRPFSSHEIKFIC